MSKPPAFVVVKGTAANGTVYYFGTPSLDELRADTKMARDAVYGPVIRGNCEVLDEQAARALGIELIDEAKQAISGRNWKAYILRSHQL